MRGYSRGQHTTGSRAPQMAPGAPTDGAVGLSVVLLAAPHWSFGHGAERTSRSHRLTGTAELGGLGAGHGPRSIPCLPQ
jgi:hypothetical protein